LRPALRAHRDEPEAGDHLPEMLERKEYDSAFRFRRAVERQQVFSRIFFFHNTRRWMRVHSPDLRLPLNFAEESPTNRLTARLAKLL